MENIEAFIRFGINKDFSLKQAKKAIWGLIIFYILGLFYGIMLGGTALIFGILIVGIGGISALVIQTIHQNDSTAGYTKALGITALSGMINFSLLSLIFCQMLKTPLVINVMVGSIPILSTGLLYLITIRRIKKGLYKNTKELKKSNLCLYSIVGAVIGFWIARTAFKGINQTSALVIVVLCFMFLSLTFCLGMINLLKFYYIKKYNIAIV